MTVIAYKDGVLASDTAVWSGDGVFLAHDVKIARRPDGSLYGCAGDIAGMQTLKKHFLEIGDLDHFIDDTDTDVAVRIFKPDGACIEVIENVSCAIYPEFEAIGIGRVIAMGAMAAGATAEQAVAIAIKRRDGCGGDVVSLRHDNDHIVRRSVDEVLQGLRG